RQVAQYFLLLMGTTDDLLEGGDEFLLVVDQTPERGKPGAAGEFTDVPRILSEEIEGAFLGRAGETRGVRALRARKAVEAARADANPPRIRECAHLQQDPVAILQRADHRSGVAAGEKMPVERGEG